MENSAFGPSGADGPAIGADGPVGKPPEPVVLCSESSSIPASATLELSRPTVESGGRRAISRFRRRFAVVLASGVLIGVGGGGRPAESAAGLTEPSVTGPV